jgi:AcrR family transcriptional regulator
VADKSPDTTRPTTGRTYGGVSPEQRRADRRARLVEAGLALYGSQGFAATSIDAVCAEAGLTKRYFYESFGSAEELLAAVYLDATARVQGRVADAVVAAGDDLHAAVAAGVSAYFHEIDQDRRTANVILSELLSLTGRTRAAIRGATESWTTLIATVLEGRAYRGHDSRLVAASVWALFAGSAIRWALDDYAEPVEALIALTTDVVTDVLAGVTGT